MQHVKILFIIVIILAVIGYMLMTHKRNSITSVVSAQTALSNFLQQPAHTIICKQLMGGCDEGAVVKCSNNNTNYIVKLFQNSTAGKNEALWTQLADNLKIGPKVYYAEPTGTYFIMEFVAGASLVPQAITAVILQGIAKSLALLHQSTAPFAHTSEIFSQIQTKCQKLQTSGVLKQLLANLWEYLGTLKEKIDTVPVPLVPCHNDTNPRNIFVHTHHVTLIDWGDAAIGNPYYDIAIFFVLNSLTPEQEKIFLAQYDVKLFEPQWQAYVSMLKQVLRFEFALNLLLGVQALQKDLLFADTLPQTEPLRHYLTLFAEQQVPNDATFFYSMALASLDEVRG